MKSEPIKILIVDDDSDDRFFLKEAVLEIDESFECAEAYDGIDALAMLRTTRFLPDYIFMDINMPRMDGTKCLNELKSDAKLRGIPVIILTTSSYPKDLELTHKLGAIDYLIKPMGHDALIHIVRSAIIRAEESSSITHE